MAPPPSATVYVGVSVDGFIARVDGTVDFLDRAEPVDGLPLDHDMGFGEFLASVDALVMGRNTYDFVIDGGYDWPYGDKPVIVVTSRPIDIPEAISSTVVSTALSPGEIRADLTARGLHHLYVDGGLTVQSWIREGLIDDFIIAEVPVLIGRGIPLFGELDDDILLSHVDTTVHENGLVHTHWRVRQPTGTP